MAFASLTRTLGYIQQAQLKNNRLYIKTTGAEINLNWTFLTDFASAFRLYAYIVVRNLLRRAQGYSPEGKICFFPQQPAPWYSIWSVTQFCDLEFTHHAEEADFVFIFDDKTHTNAVSKLPEKLTAKIINEKCTNISKQAVADTFEQVFGYPLEVDPTLYTGQAVCKSNNNATHDGQIIQCPVSKDQMQSGNVYQKLINNSPDGKLVRDLRVVYAYGQIPVAYIKCRKISRRFANENTHVELKQASDLFSSTEIEKICQMAQAMGLEFGGLDVLRDEDDGRIYIVDVNKTCMGPPIALPHKLKIEAVEKIAEAFGNRAFTNKTQKN